jgi:hypothetical protein
MAQETIDFGSYPNDANADPVRVAFQKIQNNITELYAVSVSQGVNSLTTGAGLSQDFTTGNVRIVSNIPNITIQTADSLLVGVGTATGNTATINTSSTPFYIDVAPTITTSNVVASRLTGTLTTAAQPNITSVGNLTNLRVVSNVTAATVYGNVYAGFISSANISASGSNTEILLNTNGLIDTDSKLAFTGTVLRVLANIQTNNANLGNLAIANFVTGTLTTASQPNITSVGTLVNMNTSGNIIASGNVTANVFKGNVNANVIRANAYTAPVNSSNRQLLYNRLGSMDGSAELTWDETTLTITGNVTAQNINSGNLLTANFVTGVIASASNAQPNITSIGTLSTLNVTGLSRIGNLTSSGNVVIDGYVAAGDATFTGNLRSANAILGINASATNFIGDGSALSNITGSSVIGNVATSNLSYRSYITTSLTGLNYIPFVNNTTGRLPLKTNSNLSFNALTNTLTTGNLQISGNITAGNVNTNGGTISVDTITTGSPTISGTITGNWSLSDGSKLSSTYADLAECYAADTKIEAGTVVEFGGEEEVRICDFMMSKTIAGVVTTNPAYVMNSMIKCEYPVAIALQGRVPVKVTGCIRKGDMLVSAGQGRATAMSTPMIGTVIGKSLQNFDGDEGIIEVAVGRL